MATPEPAGSSTQHTGQQRAAPRHSKHHGNKCAHVHSKTKQVIDRLKVLVPYANVCKHRQALLQGRRGAGSTAATAHGDREATPAPTAGEGDRSRKRLVDEMPAPTCTQCHTPADRLHACLSCDHYGCWRTQAHRGTGDGASPHIVRHLREHGHPFAFDFSRMVVFCMECNDYVYDPTVHSWLLAAQIRWHAALCDSAEPEAKRPRIVSTGSDLSPAQTKYLKEHGAVHMCSGVRGLYNLGATCYLSVVLQTLVHNPLMRGWMLSDGHHPSTCRVGRPLWLRSRPPEHGDGADEPGKPDGRDEPSKATATTMAADALETPSDAEDEVMLGGGRVATAAPAGATAAASACMACELESSFQAFFSGETTPFGPVRLLRTLWLLRNDLAGYGQQDAHECLMAMLDTLHTGFTENVLGAAMPADGQQRPAHHSYLHPCQCLVHQAFAGVLQSTVTCSRCGNTTHAHDPMLDISLDIPTRLASLAPRAIDAALNEWLETRSPPSQQQQQQSAQGGSSRSRRGTGPRAQASLTKGNFPVLTLHDCLTHYTRAEPLPAGAYTCDRCTSTHGASDTSTTAVKQLCIKELPPVLTFQLKRFEHVSAGGRTTTTTKVDAFVRLPMHIDMTPYTASALASHSQTVAGLKAAAGNATSSTGSALPASVGGIAVHDRNSYADDPANLAGVPRDTPIPILDGPGGSATLGKRRTDATHSNPACQYTLFAIIDHIGHLDTGHYTAYAKHRGQWYKFDDATVTPADIRDVLGLAEENKARQGRPAKGKAYMAFYVKSVLDYHDGAAQAAQAAQTAAQAADRSAGQSRDSAPPTAVMGASNTRINESGEWIEDAGVVRTRINANGDVKVERRGRKKGSTNAARGKTKSSKSQDPASQVPTVAAAAAAAAMSSGSSGSKPGKKKSGRTTQSPRPTAANSRAAVDSNYDGVGEEGELDDEGELDEFMASGTLDVFGINPMALVANKGAGGVTNDEESSDSDGEALWARISKEKPIDDLVPMVAPPLVAAGSLAQGGLKNDRPLFVSPGDLGSSPHNNNAKSTGGFSFDDNEDDDDDNSDFA